MSDYTGRDFLAARKALGLSRAQLARDLGISPRMLYKIEKEGARRKVPDAYARTAEGLGNGRTIRPKRRKDASGKLAKVRAPQGQPARRPKAPRGGGVGPTYDSAGQRRETFFVPARGSAGKSSATRGSALADIRAELLSARAAGRDATLTVYAVPTAPPGASRSYPPHRIPGSLDTIDDLADDSDAHYGPDLHSNRDGYFVVIVS